MNYAETIRSLEEKRDFYSAAIKALQKIARAEDGQPAVKKQRPRTPEQRARMAAAQRARHARAKAALEASKDSSEANAASVVN